METLAGAGAARTRSGSGGGGGAAALGFWFSSDLGAGLGCTRGHSLSLLLLLQPLLTLWAMSPMPAWGAGKQGGAWPSLSHLAPTLPWAGLCKSCLITQPAAPGHPRPIPHHLQPGSARNSLGLLPSTRGLQPRLLPWPSGPCPRPCRGAEEEGAGEGPAGKRHQPGQLGAGAGGGMGMEGPPSSLLKPQAPQMSPTCLVSPSNSWSPRSVGSLLAPPPPYLACLLPLSFLVSPSRAFREGLRAGREPGAKGNGKQRAGRRAGDNSISRVGLGSTGDKKAISAMGF